MSDKQQFIIKLNNKYSVEFNSKGYAIIHNLFNNKRKILIPNKFGYVYFAGEKVNFKRILFKKIYPKMDLTNKVVCCIGNNYSIDNLFVLTKYQFLNVKKFKLFVEKDSEGESILVKNKKGS